MEVELQILKHLARDAKPSVSFIDEYCAGYKDLFPEVRSYECSKYLHIGIIAPIKKKSLPEKASRCGNKFSPIVTSFYSQITVVSNREKKPKIIENLKRLKR
jgi:SRSO17 transposase